MEKVDGVIIIQAITQTPMIMEVRCPRELGFFSIDFPHSSLQFAFPLCKPSIVRVQNSSTCCKAAFHWGVSLVCDLKADL